MNLLRKVLVVISVCLLLFFSRFLFLSSPENDTEDSPVHSRGYWGEFDTRVATYTKKTNNVVFIFGLGGSGTRGVTSLFELWGCNIKFFKLNPALDNTLVFKLNPYVDDILNITGSADYDVSSLPKELLDRIAYTMEDVKTAIDHVVLSRCAVLKWPRIIYLLPVLRLHFPDCKFVQVVRDGRDMVFSKNTLQYREFSRFYLTPAEGDLPKQYRQLKFWYLVNRQVKNWLHQNAPGDSTVLRIESLVLDADESVYQSLYHTSLGRTPPYNLSNNAVFQTAIDMRRYNTTLKYGKYKFLLKEKDKKILTGLETDFKEEMAEFGYIITAPTFNVSFTSYNFSTNNNVAEYEVKTKFN